MDISPNLQKAFGIIEEVQLLINKVDILESVWTFFEELPFPAWVKNIDGQIVAVNRIYRSRYKPTKSGKTYDINRCPKILSQFRLNDETVMKSSKPQIFREICATEEDKDRISTVLKFPINGSSGTPIGVAGIELSLP